MLKKLTRLTCNTANSLGTLLKIKTFILMLKVGDKIPNFEVKDQFEKLFRLTDFKGNKLIIYFYPKDDTPGCTAQACSLRDGYQDLLAKGFKIVGVSADSPKKHQSFITKYDLPFPLISDENLVLIKAFGVWGLKKFMGKEYEGINRTTFVIDENGVIEHVISKVKTKEELHPAIENAYKEDNEIIIESFLDGVEVSVGVINYKGKVIVLPITEIVSENDFFDYEAKYLGKSKEITPARITDEVHAKVSYVAKKAYEVLKMKGFSRSEFIIVNNEPYMLEMNTVPGLTTESILPQQAKVAGISLTELFDNAIELALK